MPLVRGARGAVVAPHHLATAAGLTCWPHGASTTAARTCFDGWLHLRGGAGNSDQAEMLRQVVHFFEAHGAARFEPIHRLKDDHRANIMHRAGFKKLVKDEVSRAFREIALRPRDN